MRSAEVEGVTTEVSGLRDRVERIDRELETTIDQAISKKVMGGRSNVPQGMRSRIRNLPLAGPSRGNTSFADSGLVSSYWQARKSLRLWLVRGDLLASAEAFLEDKLKMGPGFCSVCDGDVIPAGPGRGGKTRYEVCVRFADVETRDTVRSAAHNLAGMSDTGMRLEIPEHLRQSLRALEKVSFNLKKKNPSMKWNVKFDDGVMDLVLDVKLDDDAP